MELTDCVSSNDFSLENDEDNSSSDSSNDNDLLVKLWYEQLQNGKFPIIKFEKILFFHFMHKIYAQLCKSTQDPCFIILYMHEECESHYVMPYDDIQCVNKTIEAVSGTYFSAILICMKNIKPSLLSMNNEASKILSFLGKASDYLENNISYKSNTLFLHNSKEIKYWILDDAKAYINKERLLMEYLPTNYEPISLYDLKSGNKMETNKLHVLLLAKFIYSCTTWRIQINKSIYHLTSLMPKNRAIILLNSFDDQRIIQQFSMLDIPDELKSNQLIINFPYKKQYLQIPELHMNEIYIPRILSLINANLKIELLYSDYGKDKWDVYRKGHLSTCIENPDWRIMSPFSESIYKLKLVKQWVKKHNGKLSKNLILSVVVWI